MTKLRRRIEAPADVFPIDHWRIVQTRFDHRYVPHEETIYALANGYLGLRGGFEEGRPAADDGTLVNGFFEYRPISYPEEGFGFPRQGQTILYVPEAKIIRLYVDGAPFDVERQAAERFERVLDMQAGVLSREVEWTTPRGKRVRLKTTRLVSFEDRHLAAIDWELTLLDAPARIDIVSEIVNRPPADEVSTDPRKPPLFLHKVLHPERAVDDGLRLYHCYRTELSKQWIGCGIDHVFSTESATETRVACEGERGSVAFMVDGEPDKPIRLSKFITYHTEHSGSAEELGFRVAATLDRATSRGFTSLAAEQRAFMDDFWQRSDVEIEAEGEEPRKQQIIRWNLFQLLQASACIEGHSIPARGLTGRVYEGHYFWDAEIYYLPFLDYTAPTAARQLLEHRWHQLDQARARARELSHTGALFPWRTINGDEASTFFLAGTAQYHIDAAIMYGLQKYADASGDEDFLLGPGAEMYVETARLWISLGCYPERDPEHFYINGVTGPDEYTALVNNNFYTNVMARENLRRAADIVERLARERPEAHRALVEKTGLAPQELADWRRAAERMLIPYDDRLGIHLQDDSFLDKERWDFENTPAEKYPLLIYYHYLEIYRHQVIKQADTILAMVLLSHQFSDADKKRNFDYYDPLTTGDSSLSACIQSIAAAEIGYDDLALKYFRFAAVMDLADVAGNVVDGAHMASIGGTWMALVYGFGGLDDTDGQIAFRPRLPKGWTRLRFRLTVRGRRLEVDVTRDGTTYTLREGEPFSITHRGERVALTAGQPRTLPA